MKLSLKFDVQLLFDLYKYDVKDYIWTYGPLFVFIKVWMIEWMTSLAL